MKTKDLVVGQEYVFGGQYNKSRGVLLSVDTKWVSQLGPTLRHSSKYYSFRLAVKEAGERGGLAFAMRRRYDPESWVPVVVQPNAIFATAEAYDATKAAREAEYERQYAEQERQRGLRLWAFKAREVRNYWLNVQLQNLGLEPVYVDAWNETVRLPVAQFQALLAKASS